MKKQSRDREEAEEKMAGPDLSTCTRQELWAELSGRYAAAVLIFEGQARETHRSEFGVWRSGMNVHVQGLLQLGATYGEEMIRQDIAALGQG